MGLGAHAWANTHKPRDIPGSSSSTSSYLLHHPSHLHQLITPHRHSPIIWCKCILSIASHVMFHSNPINSTTFSSKRVFNYSSPSPYTGKATLPPYDTVICFSHLSKRTIPFTPKNALLCLPPLSRDPGLLPGSQLPLQPPLPTH